MIRTTLILSAVIFGIIGFVVLSKVDRAESIPTANMKGSKEYIGWIPYWDQERAKKTFFKNIENFDYVSLFWYYLKADGTLSLYSSAKEDQEIIDFAKENGVTVLVNVANLPDFNEGGDWDAGRVDRVISSAQRRSKHIADLVELVDKGDFDGLAIDYESLPRSQREDFSLFIEELASNLHDNNKILGVAIHPKTKEFEKKEDNGSHAQDLERIAKAADQLYFMAFDFHGEKTESGPIAPVKWVKQVIEFAVKKNKVPSGKIYLHIGLYGYDWGEDEGLGLTYSDVERIIKKENPIIEWDQKSQEPWFKYAGGHTVWFANRESVLARIGIVDIYNLGGASFWRLGGEDSRIWRAI